MSSATPTRTEWFNILLLGHVDVGKSSIIRRLDQDYFIEGKGTNSLGKDFIVKRFRTKSGETVSCRIWDTADMERYSLSIPSNLYRCKQGIVFVFSLTSKHSLRDLNIWIDNAKSYYPSGLPPCIIIANKLDDVPPSENNLKEVTRMYRGYKCFETSALLGYGINEAFEFLADEILNNGSNGHREDGGSRGRFDTIGGAAFSTVDPPFNFVRIMKSCSIL